MTQRTAPPERVPAVGPPPPPSAPGVSGDHFAALLDQHQARTATAEGRKSDKSSSRKDEREPRREARTQPAADKDQRTGTDAARGTDAASQKPAAGKNAGDGAQKAAGKDAAAEGTDTKAQAPVAVTVAPVALAPESTVDSRQSTVAQAVAAPAAPKAEPVVAMPATAKPAEVPAVPVAQVPVTGDDKAKAVAAETPKAAAPAQPVAAAKQVVEGQKPAEGQPAQVTTTDAKPAAQPQAQAEVEVDVDVAKPQQQVAPQRPTQEPPPTQQTQQSAPQQATADTAGKGTARDGQPQQQPQAQAEAQPQASATTAEPAKPAVPTADSGQPAQPTAAAAPSAATAATSRPVSQATPVRLSQAPEAVENTIRIAQARGVTHARLALRPAELGGVEIHLRSTADGLVARVTADGHQAAHVLQQAGDDLRRQLQAQGIDLQRLDIGVAGEPGHGAGADAAGEQRAHADERRAGGSGDSSAEVGSSAKTQVEDTIELPDGVLVDVLA